MQSGQGRFAGSRAACNATAGHQIRQQCRPIPCVLQQRQPLTTAAPQSGLHQLQRHRSLAAQRQSSAGRRHQRCRAANEDYSSGGSDGEWADDPASFAASSDAKDGFGAAAEYEEADAGADAEQETEFDPDDLTEDELAEMEAEAALEQKFEEEGEPAVGNLADFDIDPLEDEAEAFKGKVGITPWDFIEVSDEQIKHEVSVMVDAPLETCYEIWNDRINYCQWFTLIQEMGVIPSDDPELSERFCQLRILYRWGMMPTLEIMTVLEKTQSVLQQDKALIMEEADEGLPLVGFVVFRRQDMGGKPRTLATLSLAYYLPTNLKEFVGKVGVYGDVNDILTHSMRLFAGFVESNDLEEIRRIRAEGRALVEKNLEELWDGYERNIKAAEEIVEKAREDGTLEQQRQAFEEEVRRAHEEDRRPGEEPTEAQKTARAHRQKVEAQLSQDREEAEEAAEEARTAEAEATAARGRRRPLARLQKKAHVSTGNPRGRPKKDSTRSMDADDEDGTPTVDVESEAPDASGNGSGGAGGGDLDEEAS